MLGALDVVVVIRCGILLFTCAEDISHHHYHLCVSSDMPSISQNKNTVSRSKRSAEERVDRNAKSTKSNDAATASASSKV